MLQTDWDLLRGRAARRCIEHRATITLERYVRAEIELLKLNYGTIRRKDGNTWRNVNRTQLKDLTRNTKVASFYQACRIQPMCITVFERLILQNKKKKDPDWWISARSLARCLRRENIKRECCSFSSNISAASYDRNVRISPSKKMIRQKIMRSCHP